MIDKHSVKIMMGGHPSDPITVGQNGESGTTVE